MIRAWGGQHKLTRKAHLAPSWAWNEFNDSQAQGWNQARGEKSTFQGSEPTRNLGQNFQNVFRLGKTGSGPRQAASSSHHSLGEWPLFSPLTVSQIAKVWLVVPLSSLRFARPVSHALLRQCGAHSRPSLHHCLSRCFQTVIQSQ